MNCQALLVKTNWPSKPPSAAALRSHEYELFTKYSQPTQNYTAIVDQGFVAGDILRFGDGQAFEFIRNLGSGFTTAVLAVYVLPKNFKSLAITDADRANFPLVALRIPIADKNIKGIDLHVSSFINSFIQGHELLTEKQIPVPRIFRARDLQYVAVEYIEFDFNGNDFFKRPETIDPEILNEAELALFDFAKLTSDLEQIGDFNAGQMGYSISAKKWYLLDWTDDHIEHVRHGKDDVNGRPLPHLPSLQRRHMRSQQPAAESFTVFNSRFLRSLGYKINNRLTDGKRELTTREKNLIIRLNEVIYEKRRAFDVPPRTVTQRVLEFLGWNKNLNPALN